MSGAANQNEPDSRPGQRSRGSGEGAKIIDLATRNALHQERPPQLGERFGLFAGLAIVALLVGITVWTIRQSEVKPGRPAAARPEQEAGWLGQVAIPGLGVDRQLAFDAPPASVPIPAPSASVPAPSLPPPDLSPVLANPPALPDISAGLVAEPGAKPPAGPTVVFESGGGDSAVRFAFEPGAGNDFGGSVKADRVPSTRSGGAKASSSASTGDALRTLGKGTLIPAILETAIDSNVAGGVRTVVSTDVLSADGKRSLVPRSSRLVGQYKTRRSAGQSSAYVVWTQIVRPDGVRIDIPSSAAGASERQFFDRFGAARLVSVVAGQAGEDLRARQGEPVRIMAARDVDLSLTR